MDKNRYEVIIIGAGVSGCALAYEIARYSDIDSVLVLEKYDSIAPLNSSATANSQTLHVGDIETNYTLQKASITKKTAKMVIKYCLMHNYRNEIIFSHTKMALGVGDEEVEFLLQRYEEFSELFEYLEIYDKEELKTLEPRVVFDKNGNEREENIVAVGAKNEWTTIDYQKLSQSFIENGKKETNMTLDISLNSKVVEIKKSQDGYEVKTDNKSYFCDFVVVNAGAHSLYLAHQMGYGLEYATLPVAGSFYLAKSEILKSKVYMIQNPKLPFAALHGDPDIIADNKTRFGPTALVLPKLERFTSGTYLDFFKTLRLDRGVISAIFKLLKESDIRNYILKNFLFEIPFINKYLFIKDARKIVPSLQSNEIEYAKGFGGVRPQIIDRISRKLLLGEASINTEDGVIFNMTPSPGATSCLGNGERDLKYICKYLGKKFYEQKFNDELTDGEYCVLPESIQSQKVNKIREALYAIEDRYYCPIEHGKPQKSFWDNPYSKIK